MDRVKKTAAATKKFVADHKVALAVIATAACCLTFQVKVMSAHNDFLKERGLYDEFYADPEDAEI